MALTFDPTMSQISRVEFSQDVGLVMTLRANMASWSMSVRLKK